MTHAKPIIPLIDMKKVKARQKGNKSAAVFLDRDGTLNVEKEYVFRWEDWEWIPGAVEAMKAFQTLGFRLVVITNQSGVARGFFTQADVEKLHSQVERDLRRHGVKVDGFYFCPHGPGDGCDCRKPAPGMILKAAKDLKIDLARSFVVGDKAIDVRAGRQAGATSILVETGYGRDQVPLSESEVPVVRDVLGAAEWVRARLGLKRKKKK